MLNSVPQSRFHKITIPVPEHTVGEMATSIMHLLFIGFRGVETIGKTSLAHHTHSILPIVPKPQTPQTPLLGAVLP